MHANRYDMPGARGKYRKLGSAPNKQSTSKISAVWCVQLPVRSNRAERLFSEKRTSDAADGRVVIVIVSYRGPPDAHIFETKTFCNPSEATEVLLFLLRRSCF